MLLILPLSNGNSFLASAVIFAIQLLFASYLRRIFGIWKLWGAAVLSLVIFTAHDFIISSALST
jgi:hypothetical protein